MSLKDRQSWRMPKRVQGLGHPFRGGEWGGCTWTGNIAGQRGQAGPQLPECASSKLILGAGRTHT